MKSQDQSKDHSQSPSKSIPFLQIFRFADKVDILMMVLGAIGSISIGACTPISFYIIVQYDNSYSRYNSPSQIPDGYDNMIYIIYIGIVAFMCGWMMVTMWVITGQRQSSKCKHAYYESLIKQDAEFFDCNQHSFVNSKFTLDTNYFETAIGEKMGIVLQTLGNFMASIAISFWQGWFMTLIMLGNLIFIFLSAFFNMQSLKAKENKFQEIYSRAGGRAQEAINSIKTVKQFNAQEYESNLYLNCLSDPSNDKLWPILKISLSSALLNTLLFFIFSFGFWFGGYCLKGGSLCLTDVTGHFYTAQNVQFIFFSILVCLTELASIPVAIKQIMFGREAAFRIFEVIDRVPKIAVNSGGLRLEKIQGIIELKNVTFAYPKDKKRNVLKDLSLTFDSKSSAIVGESGCGKSTIVQLLMRLYDPDEGQVLIDGHDIRNLDPVWLRSKIGYVGQQPVLFAATIRENLLFANPDATEKQMAAVLKKAQVYDFVYGHLEKGLDTYVGVGGSQISGGQKQRIAIARALIKQPQLLILDEATSALDRTNQRLIQDTLNKISETLTSITIAHRISTIKNSRTVFVLEQGCIKQQGKFQDMKYFRKQKRPKDKQENLQDTRPMENNSQPIIMTSQMMLNSMDKINIEDEPSPDEIANNAQKKAELLQKYKQGLVSRIFSFNKNKKLLYGFSLLISTGVGLIYPIFSMFLAQIYINTIDYKDSDAHSRINATSLKFLINGITAFALYFLQTFTGEIVGDEISTNLRTQTYNKILKMPISWFDKRENTCGVVSSRLSVECEKVKELITNYFYFILRCVSNIISGFVIMFVFDWRMALILIALITILIITGTIKSHFKTNLTKQIDIVNKKTGGMIEESLINIRTVSAFNMQDQLIKKYEQELKAPFSSLIKIGVIAGIMNGIVIFIVISAYGMLFEIGIQLMIHNGADRLEILKAILSFNLMSLVLAQYMAFLPDVEGTELAAVNIFSILDAEDQIQMQEREGSKRLIQGFQGAIQLRGVSFKYEDRQQKVLEGLNLCFNPGEKAALVGHSGCGKSTLIQLLLRFYEPTSGKIFIGDTDIRDFDLTYLRRQFGVVGQQPVIFNGSFRNNIRYNTQNITEQQLRAAADKANALTFIQGGEQNGGKNGFDREVGVRGFHISGGQKQRVAIARVLLRNPQILLLDEATSALDAVNQREVQESLDSAMSGRTTITVAHRIQTIKNSDVIHVFQNGSIVESGKYDALMEYKGVLWKIEKGGQH